MLCLHTHEVVNYDPTGYNSPHQSIKSSNVGDPTTPVAQQSSKVVGSDNEMQAVTKFAYRERWTESIMFTEYSVNENQL